MRLAVCPIGVDVRYSWSFVVNREVVEVGTATVFQDLSLRRLVVMLFDDALGGVHPIARYFLRIPRVAVPRDRAGSYLVGTPTRRALTRFCVLRELAGVPIVSVRAFAVNARLGGLISPDSQRVLAGPTLQRSEERCPSVIIVFPRSILLDLRGQCVADTSAESNEPLPILLVLELSVSFWSMNVSDELLFGVVVAEIEAAKRPESCASMPGEFEKRVMFRSIPDIVSSEVPNQRERVVSVKLDITRLLVRRNLGDVHPITEAVLDRLDPLQELHEVLQCLHLTAKRRRCDSVRSTFVALRYCSMVQPERSPTRSNSRFSHHSTQSFRR